MESNISSKAEDYLRTIHESTSQKGFVRIKDIARELDITSSTVVEMMKKLNTKGLVNYEKYGGITLTERGTEIALIVEKRHETFRNILEILLVPKDIALKDAHILEHKLQPKTILQFSRFLDLITTPEQPMFIKKWTDNFKKYCESHEKRQQHNLSREQERDFIKQLCGAEVVGKK
ncbi:MAG: metal-dependent transcriptional regulator [Candidatus Bathyarchaeota archaeon]|nr:metal-dependent transcriptional regulator [Candidatus Bathyarchaeota archaeon]